MLRAVSVAAAAALQGWLLGAAVLRQRPVASVHASVVPLVAYPPAAQTAGTAAVQQAAPVLGLLLQAEVVWGAAALLPASAV